MTDSEKLVTWGLLALIAWELRPKQQQQAAGLGATDPTSNTPAWIQQLSNVEQQEYMEEVRAGDVIDNLLAIPQGPGGTSNYNTTNIQPINFFNPTRGIFSLCNPTAPTVLQPVVRSIA